MEIFETARFERLQFFDGQRLFASDLQALEAFNRELRWLHNQSLHQIGIGNGFAVSAEKGDREVVIGPGYAVDSNGREIVLAASRTEPIPPIAGEDDGSPAIFYLTVAYPNTDQDLEEVEGREGVCLPRGVVRRREEPVFCWVRLKRVENTLRIRDASLAEDLKRGDRIILATAEILNCQLEHPLDFSQRRNVKPPKQPYIACGSMSGLDSWQLCDPTGDQCEDIKEINPLPGESPAVLPFILSAEISTEAANFVTTPCYSAQIVGPRIKLVKNINNKEIKVVVDGSLTIQPQSVGPRSFAVHVLLWMQALDLKPETLPIVELHLDVFSDWDVTWIGVEG